MDDRHTGEVDLASARQVAHDRLASLDGRTDEQLYYLENVDTLTDEFTDLECTDGDGDDMIVGDSDA